MNSSSTVLIPTEDFRLPYIRVRASWIGLGSNKNRRKKEERKAKHRGEVR